MTFPPFAGLVVGLNFFPGGGNFIHNHHIRSPTLHVGPVTPQLV
eukprot:COSAG02_NODE_42437_length_384_cov_1.221053_1_plen_43_part_10